MNIKNIKRFLALVEHQSFSKAAEFLALSQPSLSREIQKLEEDLGRKLIIRLNTGIRLTACGEIYRNSFQKIMAEIENAKISCESLEQEIFGNIRIATHPLIGQQILPILEKYLQTESAVKIDYEFTNSREAIEKVAHCKVDFSIVASTFKHTDLKQIKLWKETIGLFSKSGKMAPTVLANRNMLNAERVLKKIAHQQLRWIDDYSILLSLLDNDNVMGLLPSHVGLLNPLLKKLREFTPSFEISLVYRTDLEKTAAKQWLIQTIKECAKNI